MNSLCMTHSFNLRSLPPLPFRFLTSSHFSQEPIHQARYSLPPSKSNKHQSRDPPPKMGGLAFSSHPSLRISRLSPSQYRSLCPLILSRIQPLYHTAQIPRSAPEKPSHGDIDILAHTPRNGLTTEQTAQTLNASANIKGGFCWVFAVPFAAYPCVSYPEDDDVEGQAESSDDGRESCFQVDLSTISAQRFELGLMVHEHGDAWMLIGSMMKRRDLSISDKGLALTMSEIQRSSLGGKKAGRLLLSGDKTEIFAYLGLNAKKWDRGFETLEELFVWVAECRFYKRNRFLKTESKAIEVGKKATGKEKKELGRWMWVKFVEEWVPAHPDVGVEEMDMKDDVKEEVLERWGKQAEHERLIETHKRKEAVASIWKDIAAMVPLEGRDLGELMKRLKKVAGSDEPQLKSVIAKILEISMATDEEKMGGRLVHGLVEKIEEYRRYGRLM